MNSEQLRALVLAILVLLLVFCLVQLYRSNKRGQEFRSALSNLTTRALGTHLRADLQLLRDEVKGLQVTKEFVEHLGPADEENLKALLAYLDGRIARMP